MHMYLINLHIHIKINKKFAGNFKHEFGRKPIEEFIALLHKSYSFKHFNANDKKNEKLDNAILEDCYKVFMNSKRRTVEKCRIQKIGDKMTTTKTSCLLE